MLRPPPGGLKVRVDSAARVYVKTPPFLGQLPGKETVRKEFHPGRKNPEMRVCRENLSTISRGKKKTRGTFKREKRFKTPCGKKGPFFITPKRGESLRPQ